MGSKVLISKEDCIALTQYSERYIVLKNLPNGMTNGRLTCVLVLELLIQQPIQKIIQSF